MFNKTRTKIFTLVAAASLATAAVAPAVSQAKPKGPSSGNKAVLCEALRLTQELWQEAAESAEAKGELDRASEDRKNADKSLGEAGRAGCLFIIEIETTKIGGKVKAAPVANATLPVAHKAK